MAKVAPAPDLPLAPESCDKDDLKEEDESLEPRPLTKRMQSQARFGNDSIFAKIAYSGLFQNTTMVVICLNAIWIGVDVQANHPVYKKQRNSDKLPLEPLSTVIEHLFCLYFSSELLVRFLAFRRKCDCLKDEWFVFDGILVLFMVIETWILAIIGAIMNEDSDGLLSKFSALRLLRLLRLTRMTRIIREVPELITLLRGMISATKAVGWILVFLLICQYVFAIIFVAQLGDPKSPEWRFGHLYWDDPDEPDPTAQELFGTIGDAMMSLFTHGMLADNLAQAMQAIKDRGGDLIDCDQENLDCYAAHPKDDRVCGRCERGGGSPFLFWLFIIFMIISAFCLLNMLIGVLCEVIQDSAGKEEEAGQVAALRDHMRQAFGVADTSRDGLVTPQEWQQMKQHEQVRESMQNLGVDDANIDLTLDQMQEALFGNEDFSDAEENERRGLTFDQFMDQIMEIRPDTDATSLDIEIMRVRIEREEKAFNERLSEIEDTIKQFSKEVAAQSENRPPSAPIPEIGSQEWLRKVPTEVLLAVLNTKK